MRQSKTIHVFDESKGGHYHITVLLALPQLYMYESEIMLAPIKVI